jgi:hypothetical protein
MKKEQIQQELKRLATQYNVDITLHQTLGELEIYGDGNEIVIVSDGHGFDIEVFINGVITDHSHIEN